MTIHFTRTVPILRMFDVAKAKEFYVDYLGFVVDWEHHFHERAPVYMQVSRGELALHLSEHHGDGTPGSTVYIETTDVRALHSEIQGKEYDYLNPGLQEDELGTWLNLLDPFGNTLRINQPPSD